jgi:hypothetical protein
MNLKSLPLRVVYDTSKHDVVRDFLVPALKQSVQYDRGVGYFSSGWLRTVSQGLVEFAQNQGRMRLIASPVLSEHDWRAIELGEQARNDVRLHSVLVRNVDELAETLEQSTLSALAWMIADDIISLKLALPINKLEGGEFHTKFGIFTDAEGYSVSFEGSNNETVRQGFSKVVGVGRGKMQRAPLIW